MTVGAALCAAQWQVLLQIASQPGQQPWETYDVSESDRLSHLNVTTEAAPEPPLALLKADHVQTSLGAVCRLFQVYCGQL